MCILWVRKFILGDEIADGHEGVEAFCNGPGKPLLLGLVLDVSRGHVDGENVACGVRC